MKALKILRTTLLFSLAVVIGLMMPELWLKFSDQTQHLPQEQAVIEAALHWHETEPEQRADMAEAKDKAEVSPSAIFSEHLLQFSHEPPVSVPLAISDPDKQSAMVEQALTFLKNTLSIIPDVYYTDAAYEMAWFDTEVAIPCWNVYLNFDAGWVCAITIDEETGGILRCSITHNGGDLAQLFPGLSDTTFEELVTIRVCAALAYDMSTALEQDCQVFREEESGGVCIVIGETEALSIPLSLRVDRREGIHFNN